MSNVVPLGVVRVAGRVFWITGVGRWESSSFVIREVSASGIRGIRDGPTGIGVFHTSRSGITACTPQRSIPRGPGGAFAVGAIVSVGLVAAVGIPFILVSPVSSVSSVS